MTEKLLTIAIPTFNRADKLEHLISSIVPQLSPLVEILVSDNASTDSTSNLMARLNDKNNSIRYVRQASHVGVDQNVDSAVINAMGRFVWICGDDDELESFAIQYVLDMLQKGDFATGWVNCSRWDTELLECWAPRIINIENDIVGTDIGTVIALSHIKFSFISSHIVRRDLWLAAQGRDKCFDCIWMMVHLQAGVNRSNFVIARPLLRQRSSDYDNVTVAKAPILLNWCHVMDMAVKYGVPREDVEPFFRVAANGPHLVNSIIHKKRYAPDAATREFFPTVGYFWRYPKFWLTAVPFHLMPAFLIRVIRNIYRWQRRLGGIQFELRDNH